MSHLTREQRYTIEVMYQNGQSKTEIANTIGKHKSVITREIKRNSDLRSGQYQADLAQRKCEKRHRQKPKKIKLTEPLKAYIEVGLIKKYSPEQIVGRAKKEGVGCVSKGFTNISGPIRSKKGNFTCS